jgi:hypothetical protein
MLKGQGRHDAACLGRASHDEGAGHMPSAQPKPPVEKVKAGDAKPSEPTLNQRRIG